jgi:Lhr-like helicase
LQRRRAADLLGVAARYRDFPILLETYRECLRDVFDTRGLKRILREVESRTIQVRTVQTKTASPFAASLLLSYTANFLYEGDAPLAERRAQTLALDRSGWTRSTVFGMPTVFTNCSSVSAILAATSCRLVATTRRSKRGSWTRGSGSWSRLAA